MAKKTDVIYVRVTVIYGAPTEMDNIGCDGMYIEDTKICTKEVKQLRDDLDAVIAVHGLTQRDMELARRKWREHTKESG